MQCMVFVYEKNMMKFLDAQEHIHMDVLCVKNYSTYTLAGIGNYLFIYSSHCFAKSVPIFLNERIHGLYVYGNYVLIKGGKQLAFIKLHNEGNELNCQCISKIECSDWIQDLIKLSDGLVGLMTSHNLFEIWNVLSKKKVDVKFCPEKYILYSCKIIGNLSEKNLIVFSGTVFGEILIWNPFEGEKGSCILHRFKAHMGAVFSIEVDAKKRIISTTSDDRSLRIWLVETPESLTDLEKWRKADIKPVHTLYGHTARVWKSLIISNCYVTAGEDSQLIVWRNDGAMLNKLSLHQESGIRGLYLSEEKDEIVTGGEDGGINVISWSHFISGLNSPFQELTINVNKNFTTKIGFVQNDNFVYMSEGSCILVHESQETSLYHSENFLTYCILEISSLKDNIALGSIEGHLVIINIVDTIKSILVETKCSNGRIYSIHWVGKKILTCGPNGSLDLWNIPLVSGDDLKLSQAFRLPQSKERWTTCALIHSDKLIVGDRMGNLHIYDVHSGKEPLHTFKKIHSYLGVTDIMSQGSNIFTIGRDGTFKSFSKELDLLSTNKLPMEWPWKVAQYKNDIMILGFQAGDLIVWSTRHREVIARHECGGGHRSCDFILTDEELKFVYVKQKRVFRVNLTLEGITRLRNGFHGKEINALKILRIEPTVIVTGSEDTTMRISLLSKSDVETLHVLKTHVSSVRSLIVYPISDEKQLVVSAGAKAQMVLWEINLNSNECREMTNYRLKMEDRNWKSVTPRPDPETRFMCLDVIMLENEIFLAVGCSDRKIRLFSYGDTLRARTTVSYSHCVLKVALLRMARMICLISMGTDGKIVFWRFADDFAASELAKFSIHQSGINCFALKEFEPGKLIFVTGGDDNKISVSLVHIHREEVTLKEIWTNSQVHSCQITGAKLLGNLLITASIDQRITLWKWSYDGENFHVKYEDQRLTSVPDVHGLEAMSRSDGTILAIVHGKGIETVTIGPS